MDFINNLLGNKPAQAPLQPEDDFADYAAPVNPTPANIPYSVGDNSPAEPTGISAFNSAGRPVVYTKWYRVWERTSPSDFYQEAIIVPFILVALIVHFWGTRRNRSRARKFFASAQPLLESEFALVGYRGPTKEVVVGDVVPADAALISAAAKLSGDNLHDSLIKEKSKFEFEGYATGRANVAFLDLKVLLWKWYNPILLLAENIFGTFFDTFKPHPERVEAVLYAFDGNEKNFVAPAVPGSDELGKVKGVANSTYDQFIFAVVNKLSMRRLRDERYDVSLTVTKDNSKLPTWATVMSESAEVTDLMLTKDLIGAVEQAGDYFEYLIATDQPTEKPTTLDEARPKKRIHLCFKLPSANEQEYAKVLPLFQAFLRLPDHLVSSAHFRPEVKKKIVQMRERETESLRKVAAQEADEERKAQTEKLKKEERDRKMRGMTAEEQRKFLEKEAEKGRRKQQKRMTTKG